MPGNNKRTSAIIASNGGHSIHEGPNLIFRVHQQDKQSNMHPQSYLPGHIQAPPPALAPPGAVQLNNGNGGGSDDNDDDDDSFQPPASHQSMPRQVSAPTMLRPGKVLHGRIGRVAGGPGLDWRASHFKRERTTGSHTRPGLVAGPDLRRQSQQTRHSTRYSHFSALRSPPFRNLEEQLSGKDDRRDDDDDGFQPTKRPVDFDFNTGDSQHWIQSKASFAPGTNSGPETCYMAGRARYSKRCTKGPNLDWRPHQLWTGKKTPRPFRSAFVPAPLDIEEESDSGPRDHDDGSLAFFRVRSNSTDVEGDVPISAAGQDDAAETTDPFAPFTSVPTDPALVEEQVIDHTEQPMALTQELLGQPGDTIEHPQTPLIVVDSYENRNENQAASPNDFPAWFIAIAASNKKKSRKHCSQEACEDHVQGQKRRRSDG